MKILHVCLAAFYIDNYSYQENILPRMHKEMGHDVKILSSTETYINGKKLGYIKPSVYINEYGIEVTRIPYVKWLPLCISKKLRIYPHILSYLESFEPDFIFLHDVQFLSVKEIKKYIKNRPNVRVVADGHSDFSNSANTFLSRWILHGFIYKPSIKRIEPYIEHFYGTLPARVDFYNIVYKIHKSKISFLPMGVDDFMVEKYATPENFFRIREINGISNYDFLIVTGGKIDSFKKQTLLLMKAVKELKNDRIKMLIFGSVSDSIKDEFDSLCDDRIKYLGWADVAQSYLYFNAADIVCFPGRHSVYWEQAAGLGKPMIVKHWEGTTHVDLGGNVIFLHNDSVEEIREVISNLFTDSSRLNEMKKIAREKCNFFSYKCIAKKVIDKD